MIRTRTAERKFKVHDIVVFNANSSHTGRWGVVVESFINGPHTFYHVRYIDHNTGLPVVCPDAERCKYAHTCPIHGSNVKGSDIDRASARDKEFYVREGLLDQSLVSNEEIGRADWDEMVTLSTVLEDMAIEYGQIAECSAIELAYDISDPPDNLEEVLDRMVSLGYLSMDDSSGARMYKHRVRMPDLQPAKGSR